MKIKEILYWELEVQLGNIISEQIWTQCRAQLGWKLRDQLKWQLKEELKLELKSE